MVVGQKRRQVLEFALDLHQLGDGGIGQEVLVEELALLEDLLRRGAPDDADVGPDALQMGDPPDVVRVGVGQGDEPDFFRADAERPDLFHQDGKGGAGAPLDQHGALAQ